MTTIRDPAIPNVEGEVRRDEFHRLDRVMTGRRLVVLLGVSALVLTAVNLAASTYLASAISELRAVEARLEDLAGLEKRLKASLEVVNTGIQTQLDNLNRDIHNKITELEDGVGQVQRRLDRQRIEDAALPEPDAVTAAEPLVPDMAAAPAPEADGGAVETTADAAVSSIKPRKPAKPPVSKVGSAYQRIESPDGKVYYRRLQ